MSRNNVPLTEGRYRVREFQKQHRNQERKTRNEHCEVAMSLTSSRQKWHRLTERDTLAVDVDKDTQERSEARRQQEIEARDPAADNGTLFKTLLSKLTIDQHVNRLFIVDLDYHITYVEIDTKDCTPAFSKIAKRTTILNKGAFGNERREWELTNVPECQG